LSDFLKDNGFEHYEVSNFAKPDFIQDTILPIGNIKNILELVLLHILTTDLMSEAGMLPTISNISKTKSNLWLKKKKFFLRKISLMK
jgi:hypothetical protein